MEQNTYFVIYEAFIPGKDDTEGRFEFRSFKTTADSFEDAEEKAWENCEYLDTVQWVVNCTDPDYPDGGYWVG